MHKINNGLNSFSEKRNWPLVTIGIPTYNRPAGLRRALDIIVHQTYPNLDIVISDNCSTTPETASVIREFMSKDKRIRFFKQRRNIGPTNNFNFLVRQAKGNFFMWAADDNYFDSNYLVEKLMDKMLENENYLLVFPDFNVLENNKIKKHVLSPLFEKCNNSADYFLASVRFSSFQIYGLFNLIKLEKCGVPLRCNPDYYENLYLAKVFTRGDVRFVKNVCINFTSNGCGLSSKYHPFHLLCVDIKTLFLINYIYLFSNYNLDKKVQAIVYFSLIHTKYILILALSCMRLKNLKRIMNLEIYDKAGRLS